MKFLVTGAEGMLGFWVTNLATQFGKVVACGHEQLDITDGDTLRAYIDQYRPNAIINCAGIVKERKLPEQTFYNINGLAPKMMHEMCKTRGIIMTQVSTDCVFDGSKPHDETDIPNATDVYGKSKAMGEQGDIIVRGSFIGIGKRGFVSWLMSQKVTVDGYMNVLWNGVTVNTYAKYIVALTLRKERGIYHVYGPDTTKYDVCNVINELFNLKLIVNGVSEPKSDMRLRGKVNCIYVEENIREQFEQYRREFVEHFSGDPGRA